MKIRMMRLAAACVVAGSLVGGLDYGGASAASNLAPTVSGGSMTVRYEDVYSIEFTASDPDGDALTVVAPPVNDDWIGCDDGPATSFTCEYSSSRYYDPAPLPAAPLQRTVSYSVSDGTTTSTGVWTVTVLPPPTLEIVGRPTVTEGGRAVLQVKLSANTYGSLLFPAHATAVDTADGSVISSTDFIVEFADGQTTAELRIPIDDDATLEPTEYFTVSVDASDAVPYRFATGGNLVTVLDNDGKASADKVAPVVAKHRNVIVERGGSRPAWVPYSPPTATDAVDGALPAVCNPAPMAAMPAGVTKVTCTATDAAGNAASNTFQVTVRSPKSNASAKVVGGGHRQCLTTGESVWVEAEGFTANSYVTIQLQSSSLEVTRLKTVRADRKGRIRLLVKVPTAAAGDADVVVLGPAGNDDLVRMIPVKVARNRHQYGGRILSFLRNCQCD
jgi:HYR domain